MIQHRQIGGVLHLGLFGPLRGSSDETVFKISRATTVIVHADSTGGDAQLADDVASALLEHPSTVAFVRNAQSAAAIIARSCQSVMIDLEGKMMLHGGSTTVCGDAFALGVAADTLRLVDRRLGEILTFRAVHPEILERVALGGDHFFNAKESVQAGLADAISADHPEWPAPAWCAELEAQPASPDERIILEVLNAVGPITVADLGDFSRRLGLWFHRCVSEQTVLGGKLLAPLSGCRQQTVSSGSAIR